VDWLTEHKLPIGQWAKHFVDWLTDNAYWVFDAIAAFLDMVIDGVLWLIQTPHPFVIVFMAVALGYLIHRKVTLTAFIGLSLLLIINLGYWVETTETLALVMAASVVCMVMGVPIGVYGAHNEKFYAVLRPVLDLMQTIPTFVYLIPAVTFFGLGMVPGLIATAIFAIAAPIRLTQLGVSSTPQQLIEAGMAFGATKRQLLWKIELPYALPQIMAGFTQTIMLSLSMVVIAALVGANGLGVPVVRALNTLNVRMGFEAGLCIVLVAIILDRLFRKEAAAGGRK